MMRPIGAALLVLISMSEMSLAQTIDLQKIIGPNNGETSARIIQLFFGLTVLSLAPALLITVTCFTRFVIAFAFLRAGLGMPSTPSNTILISLSLFMTFFVMAPTFDRAYESGIKPLMENRITEAEALPRIAQPFREFMMANVRSKDLELFAEFAGDTVKVQESSGGPDLRVLVPAFLVSELRRGFEIGFLILLPFLVIDLIVAILTMSMGMMMLSPTVISLPFKVMFFVLIDGWNRIVGSLLRSVS